MSNQQDRVQPQRLERKYLVEERDRIQPQRFEMKYLVEERVALGIRDWVRSYLDVDEHGATHADLSYPVHPRGPTDRLGRVGLLEQAGLVDVGAAGPHPKRRDQQDPTVDAR